MKRVSRPQPTSSTDITRHGLGPRIPGLRVNREDFGDRLRNSILANSAIRDAETEDRNWLPDMDLNHDKQIQSLLCYRYTIGQTSASKVSFPVGESRTEQ